MPNARSLSNGQVFKGDRPRTSGRHGMVGAARAAAIIGLCVGAVAPRGASTARAADLEVSSQPFADDSMTRQSAASLYEADSVPAFEPPVSVPLSHLQSEVQPGAPSVAKTKRRHRPVRHHEYARAEHSSVPAPGTPSPRKHPNVVMRFFTWWNHLVKGHSWAQVPFAPNDKNPSAGLEG